MGFDAKKPRILVALGGRSSERAISISSGQAVAKALEIKGYPTDILDVGTGKFHQIPEIESLEKDSEKLENVPNFPLADIKRHFSAVFIALHGKFGEDGGFQSLLEEIDVKYVGGKPLTCAVAQDKRFAKIIAASVGVPTAPYQMISSENENLKINFPVVVKPNEEGSSVGVYICQNKADYDFAVKENLKKYDLLIVEEYLGKEEYTVPVLEDQDGKPKVLPVVDINPQKSFYNFEAKYDGTTEKIVPAKIDPKLNQKMQDLALKTYQALGFRHFARVDFIVDKSGVPNLLDINPIPGLTSESLFPRSAKAAGISFEELIEHLVELALK